MKKLKILIVEDDEFMEFLLNEIVETFTDDVLIARDGQEAVDICHDNPDIDLILMDIRMPKLDGFEATIAIRKFNSSVVIIAQTACAYSDDEEESKKIGFNDYVSKPMSEEMLAMLIEKHIEGKV
ncbi:MAG: response regulator [Candidatus Roizmanbacteria bacterium]